MPRGSRVIHGDSSGPALHRLPNFGKLAIISLCAAPFAGTLHAGEKLMNSGQWILGLSAVIASVGLTWGQQGLPPFTAQEEIVRRTSNTWNRPFHFPSRVPEVTASVIEYPAGAVGPHQTNPYTRYLYVLEGTLTLEVDDGGAVEFPAGSLILSGSTWLVPRNKGNVPVKLLVIDQTEVGQPNSVLEK
jgi:quercetin dioxygenase-like cupin family protein